MRRIQRAKQMVVGVVSGVGTTRRRNEIQITKHSLLQMCPYMLDSLMLRLVCVVIGRQIPATKP